MECTRYDCTHHVCFYTKKENARAIEEASQQDALLRAAGQAAIEEERKKQMIAIANDFNPEKESTRIREKHQRDTVSLEFFRQEKI